VSVLENALSAVGDETDRDKRECCACQFGIFYVVENAARRTCAEDDDEEKKRNQAFHRAPIPSQIIDARACQFLRPSAAIFRAIASRFGPLLLPPIFGSFIFLCLSFLWSEFKLKLRL
jgi:hypothetical protein